VVGSENGEIGKGFREMLRPAKDGAIPEDDRVALAWIFKQCGTASSSVKPTSMGISDAVRILSDGARHSNEFEPPIRMEVEPGRRIFESRLRTRHFLLGFFAPLGHGLFSTRSTSKGISEAARMLSDKVSRPEEKESPGG